MANANVNFVTAAYAILVLFDSSNVLWIVEYDTTFAAKFNV